MRWINSLGLVENLPVLQQADIVGSPAVVSSKLRWKLDSIDTSLVLYGEYKGAKKIKIVGESADQGEAGTLVVKPTINGVEQTAQSFNIIAGTNELEIAIPAYAGYAEIGFNYDVTSTLAVSFLIYPSTEVLS